MNKILGWDGTEVWQSQADQAAFMQNEFGPFRTKRVWVVPLGELLEWLRAQRNAPVEFERLARFADRL